MYTPQLIFLAAVLLEIIVFHTNGATVPITIYEYESKPNYGDGSYKYSYETSDGSVRSEEGFLKPAPNNEHILVVFGSYSYMDPQGAIHIMEYISDENGFRINMNGDSLNRIGSDLLASLLGRGVESTTSKRMNK